MNIYRRPVVCAQCGDKTWLTSVIDETRSADLQCHLSHETWRSSKRPSYIITSTTTSQLQTQAELLRWPNYSSSNPSPAYPTTTITNQLWLGLNRRYITEYIPYMPTFVTVIHSCWMSSDRLQWTEWLIKKPYTISLLHYHYKHLCKQNDFTTRGENPCFFILFICFRYFPLTPIVNLHYFYICDL
jgi:hypothetical protein